MGGVNEIHFLYNPRSIVDASGPSEAGHGEHEALFMCTVEILMVVLIEFNNKFGSFYCTQDHMSCGHSGSDHVCVDARLDDSTTYRETRL